MKIRPDIGTGCVIIVITPKEAMKTAKALVESAIQSGAPLESGEQGTEPTNQDEKE